MKRFEECWGEKRGDEGRETLRGSAKLSTLTSRGNYKTRNEGSEIRGAGDPGRDRREGRDGRGNLTTGLHSISQRRSNSSQFPSSLCSTRRRARPSPSTPPSKIGHRRTWERPRLASRTKPRSRRPCAAVTLCALLSLSFPSPCPCPPSIALRPIDLQSLIFIHNNSYLLLFQGGQACCLAQPFFFSEASSSPIALLCPISPFFPREFHFEMIISLRKYFNDIFFSLFLPSIPFERRIACSLSLLFPSFPLLFLFFFSSSYPFSSSSSSQSACHALTFCFRAEICTVLPSSS